MPDDSHQASTNANRASGPVKRSRAGAAFMRALERDPAAQAALRRVQRQLRAIAEAFRSLESERSKRERQAAVERLAEEVRQALRDAGDELTARGLPTPKTLEEWEHLARVIEMPFDTVRAGDYTLRDVFVMALAWLDRQKIIRGRIAAGTTTEVGPEKSARTFTVAALRDLIGLRNTALNKYAKLAGVETPRRGQRNFQYGAADVRRILDAIITYSSEEVLVARCQAALREIAE